MSEAYRQRYLFLKNRLEELLSRHGPPPDPEVMGADLEPTWGPLGSLARRLMDEQAFEALLALDRHMARSALEFTPERPSPSEPGESDPPQQAPQNRALEASTAMSMLDGHGETPLFGCPVCGEESAKASVPLDLWHCTQCGTNGRASRLVPRPHLPDTPEHVV